MLVIVAGEHLLSPQQVCPTCLLADRAGQPRWQDGQLKCGNRAQPDPLANNQYECPMGFRLVEVTG
ncbi:MAG: hypothetical protein RLZZ511_2874 [Cyanobacteriota bacterium]|jgi:hypothetical protein